MESIVRAGMRNSRSATVRTYPVLDEDTPKPHEQHTVPPRPGSSLGRNHRSSCTVQRLLVAPHMFK